MPGSTSVLSGGVSPKLDGARAAPEDSGASGSKECLLSAEAEMPTAPIRKQERLCHCCPDLAVVMHSVAAGGGGSVFANDVKAASIGAECHNVAANRSPILFCAQFEMLMIITS